MHTVKSSSGVLLQKVHLDIDFTDFYFFKVFLADISISFVSEVRSLAINITHPISTIFHETNKVIKVSVEILYMRRISYALEIIGINQAKQGYSLF
jgi:hypothetical protein